MTLSEADTAIPSYSRPSSALDNLPQLTIQTRIQDDRLLVVSDSLLLAYVLSSFCIVRTFCVRTPPPESKSLSPEPTSRNG